ncbi:antitoxin [Nocardioides marmoriginsengisoli]|uniref:Antitoxin n=1 Tax=Nocardioides marmoriginsengisoli TaxID=661483 RepID=A0A3N0CPN2_9ACTN|nr:antitoxin [Nocardioides marmoriginsengisoli]RNL65427.1 antitoxin [Nocardioides marmoriginsengisoli]
MGFLDDAKEKLTKAVDSQGEKIASGLDKAGDLINEKTGGKFGDKVDTGVDKAKDALDGLDGQDDDIK